MLDQFMILVECKKLSGHKVMGSGRVCKKLGLGD